MQLCDMHVVFQPKVEHVSNSVDTHPQLESDLDAQTQTRTTAVDPAPYTDLPSCAMPQQISNGPLEHAKECSHLLPAEEEA